MLAWACARPSAEVERDDYLRHVGVSFRGNVFALRFLDHQMPLRVHLPVPPDGMFEDGSAVLDSVRDGFTDWADVAAPGVPSFRFIEDPRDAEIRVVWELEPDGSWYIAHCVYNSNAGTRTHSVERILVTARHPDGYVADLTDVYRIMLHEVGHALGLYGHSPTTGDIMHKSAGTAQGLSDRDRNTLKRLYGLGNGTRIPGGKRTR